MKRKIRNVLFMVAILGFSNSLYAGWASSVITACNETGCWPINVPVDINPPTTFCF